MRAAQADILLTLCDLFGLFPCSQQLAGRKIIHWLPVDCEPMGERDIATLRNTGGIPVCMSKFGTEQIRREGFEPLYVPHGVDTEIFKPRTAEGARNEVGLGTRKLEGLDLKVGGRMHRLLYDEQFPQAANKLGKKFGAKVGKGEVETSTRPGSPNAMADQLNDMIEEAGGEPTYKKEAATEPVHTLDITEPLRTAAPEISCLRR
jgi:hypothetical protein